jgi:hypothetical protein
MKSTTDRHGKSWRERLAGYPHLPNVKPIPERMQERFGCGTIVTSSPREVDEAMRQVPEGRLATLMLGLESEGHTVVQRGRRYFVEDFEKKLVGS